MIMSTIRVTDVSKSVRNVALVEFSDGHAARFEGYTHGLNYQIEGLRTFKLLYRGHEVFVYNSRLYRAGPMEDENRIVSIDPQYTQQRVASYWKEARRYLKLEYLDSPKSRERDQLWGPWRIVCGEGWLDFAALSEGRAKLLGK
jgi:hypothetical protein